MQGALRDDGRAQEGKALSHDGPNGAAFKPMAEVIIRKYRHMALLNSKLEEHKDMMERMRKCKDPIQAKKMVEELDELLDHSPPPRVCR